MALGGYILLYRKLMEGPAWTQLPAYVIKLLVYCILKANYKALPFYDGARQIMIPRGSFVTTIRSCAVECRLSLKQVRTGLRHLGNLEILAHEAARTHTLITIVNYDTYQGQPDRQGTDTGNQRAREGPNVNKDKEANEVKQVLLASPKNGDAPPPVSGQRKRTPADPRSKPFRDAWFQVYEARHGDKPDYDGSDGAALKRLLAGHKELDLPTWTGVIQAALKSEVGCYHNPLRSERFRLRELVPHWQKFIAGPIRSTGTKISPTSQDRSGWLPEGSQHAE